ncbi:hypothetical protein AB1L88_26675 [Tautonia sp. JC769]|uniref:hypothetical protein n=1 Tax=Tautonia sp. JC769 TaxID=3232135 RepID=UPI00345A054C
MRLVEGDLARSGESASRRRRPRNAVLPLCEALEARSLLASDVRIESVVMEGPSLALQRTTLHEVYIDHLLGPRENLNERELQLRQQGIGRLDSGQNRQRVVLDLLRQRGSSEVQVEHAYLHLRGRGPLGPELNRGAAILNQVDRRGLVRSILVSPGFFQEQSGGSRREWIADVYQQIVRREPTEAETERSLRALGIGVGPAQVVRHLQDSPEARGILVAAVYSAAGLSPDPLQVQEGLQLLNRPFGQLVLQSRVLASEGHFARVTGTRVGPASGFSAQADSSFVTTNFSMSAQIDTFGYQFHTVSSAIAEPSLSEWIVGASASFDGTLWAAQANGVSLFDSASNSWSLLDDRKDITHLAAVSELDSWGIGRDPNTFESYLVRFVGRAWDKTAYPLPDGDTPSDLAATNDGTLFVLGRSGVYVRPADGSAFTPLPSNLLEYADITAGPGNSLWALGKNGGEDLLWYFDPRAAAWIPAPMATPVAQVELGILQIQGGADGSLWLLTNQGTYVAFADSPAFARVDPSSLPAGAAILAPTSGNLTYAVFNTSDAQDEALTRVLQVVVGILDQPAVPFVPFSADDAEVYSKIAQAISLPSSVDLLRGRYNDSDAPIATWRNDLKNLQPPAGVDPDAFRAIQGLLLVELDGVSNVQTLFGNYTDFLRDISDPETNLLQGAASYVQAELTGKDSDQIVTVFLEAWAGAIFAGIAADPDLIAAFPEADYSPFFSENPALAINEDGFAHRVVISQVRDASTRNIATTLLWMLDAGFSSALSDVNGDGVPDRSSDVDLALGGLADGLADFFQSNKKSLDDARASILADFGRLRLVGALVTTGAWNWPDDAIDVIEQAATRQYEILAFQTLIPAKWELVNFAYGNPDEYPLSDTLDAPIGLALDSNGQLVDVGDVYVRRNRNSKGHLYACVTFAHEIGSNRNFYNDSYVGPYPTQQMFERLFITLEVEPEDFWNRQGNWSNLPSVEVRPRGSFRHDPCVFD